LTSETAILEQELEIKDKFLRMELDFKKDSLNDFETSIEPLREMAAYEALWKDNPYSFKKIAEIFARNPGSMPSDLVSDQSVSIFRNFIKENVLKNLTTSINVLINYTYDYPQKLRDAEDPVEFLYYQGDLSLLKTRMVSIVGARKASAEGIKRAQQLARDLVRDNITIASGLAEGIDTAAHTAAIEFGGKTIAVIGTPLDEAYPKFNKSLQEKIAKEHLLISQVPFWRYKQQNFKMNRWFFPERNKTMSALSEATIIVEASDTSGTLIQAKAALQQGRKLFILNSCFENPNINWPKRFEDKAIRVRGYEDIKNGLGI
jgi:DNA processing protein